MEAKKMKKRIYVYGIVLTLVLTSCVASGWLIFDTPVAMDDDDSNSRFYINASDGRRAKLFFWDEDDGQFWEWFIDEDAPNYFYESYYDGSTYYWGRTVRYQASDSCIHWGFGDSSPVYRIEVPPTDNVHGKMRANDFICYSDKRAKINLSELSDTDVLQVCRLIDIYLYKDVESGTNNDGKLIFNDTLNTYGFGCLAQDLYYNILESFDKDVGKKLANYIVHVPEDDSKDHWSVNYKAISLLYSLGWKINDKRISALEDVVFS